MTNPPAIHNVTGGRSGERSTSTHRASSPAARASYAARLLKLIAGQDERLPRSPPTGRDVYRHWVSHDGCGDVRPELSEAGLRWLVERSGATAVAEVQPLLGGAACFVDRVELESLSGPVTLVVKRFGGREPDPAVEWRALKVARLAAVPTPEPLAFDVDGRWFSTPTIVMSWLNGKPTLDPSDLNHWTREFAETLTAVHATTLGSSWTGPGRPAIWDRWAPDGLADSDRAAALVRSVSTIRRMDWQRGLTHGDFHPGNVLFARGRCVGVVDWVSARHAPVISDVARCRAAMAVWPGGPAPDQFAAHYASASENALDGMGHWDALAGAVTLQQRHALPNAYRDLGVTITGEEIVRRVTTFVDAALDRA